MGRERRGNEGGDRTRLEGGRGDEEEGVITSEEGQRPEGDVGGKKKLASKSIQKICMGEI